MKSKCPHCSSSDENEPRTGSIVRIGFFYRASDRIYIRRWRCKPCHRSFSTATSDPCFRQKKRHLNVDVFESLCSTNSQRRTARTLKCDRKTVVRKFLFLAKQAEQELEQTNRGGPLITHVQFDEMESHEHTKLKPISMAVAVSARRLILCVEVAQMPCARSTAALSRKKYGKRKDDRLQARLKLISALLPFVHAAAQFRSDQNIGYPPLLKQIFPHAKHKTYKGRKPRHSGQGELKIGARDPLWAINHTCAMFRANVNRLIRRTWCTTKKIDRLQKHMTLYAVYHNRMITEQIARASRTADRLMLTG